MQKYRSRVLLGLVGLIGNLTISAAKADMVSLTVEPIIGYEQVKQVLPTVHSVNRTIYGARILAGILLLSAESEYTHGETEEILPELTQKDTGEKLKVGLRSGFRLGQLLQVHARGGMQASREKNEQTVAGVTTTTYQDTVYHPYAGAGARAALSSKISATADVVAVIPSINDFSRNEYLITAGFAIRLP